MPTVLAVINLATLPRTAPTRFLHQECHTTTAGLAQGIDTPTTEGTDHTPTMAPDIGHISADLSLAPITTSSSFRRHTAHSSSSHHSSSCYPSADGCSHHLSCHDTKRHSHIPSCTCHFSNRCHSTCQSGPHSSNPHCTIQGPKPRNAKQLPRPSTPHKSHHCKTVTIQGSPFIRF